MLKSTSQTAWLLEHGRLVDPSQSLDRIARLLLVDGRVAAIDPSDAELPANLQRLDCRGCIVAPGLVDIGADLGEPGRQECETIRDGMRAAVAGGYSTVACSSFTDPPIDSPAVVQFIQQKALQADLARVVVIGCVSKGGKGTELAEIGSLAEAGAVAVSDAPRPIDNTGLLRCALEYCQMFGLPLIDHPEVSSLSAGGLMHEGSVQLRLGLAPIPAEAEDLATARDLRLVETTGGRLHLANISTSGSIELCRRARQRGIPFTVGIQPVHLHLDDSRLESFESNYKLNPPLRSDSDLESCRRALADGGIDLISSGHRPWPLEAKMQQLDAAPFGVSSLETCLAQIVTYAIEPGLIDWPAAISLLSVNPARLLGLTAGSLQVGRPGDVVVIDPQHRWQVGQTPWFSRNANTPLLGCELIGRARYTLVDGRLKWDSQRDWTSH